MEKKLADMLCRIALGVEMIDIGSRAPIDGVPVWLTPDIAGTGIATGELLARLQEGAPRNSDWLDDAGVEKLQGMLETGEYSIKYPEHGALLAVVALFNAGENEAAANLLSQIQPWMDEIQFYPEPPSDRIEQKEEILQMFTISDMIKQLKAKLRESSVHATDYVFGTTIARKIYFDSVSLFLETMVDGWPCQIWTDGWNERCQEILSRVPKERFNDCGEVVKGRFRRHNNQGKLVAVMQTIVTSGHSKLTGRDVGFVRKILIDFLAKYGGPPGTDKFVEATQQRFKTNRYGNMSAYIPIIIARLEKLENKNGGYSFEGLEVEDPLLIPVTSDEANMINQPIFVRTGDDIPSSFIRLLKRCYSGTLGELLERGIVTSPEQLASFTTQLVAEVAPFDNPIHKTLWGRIYTSFRHSRRTLLLLNLETQIRVGELPWVNAMNKAFKTQDGDNGEKAAKNALNRICRVILDNFPVDGFPNKLQQNMRVLIAQAKISRDIVMLEQHAADIFCGAFSIKYSIGAVAAAKFVRQNAPVYERFWRIAGVYDTILATEKEIFDMRDDEDRRKAETIAGRAAREARLAERDALIEFLKPMWEVTPGARDEFYDEIDAEDDADREAYHAKCGEEYDKLSMKFSLSALIRESYENSRLGPSLCKTRIAEDHSIIQCQQILCCRNLVTVLDGFGLKDQISVQELEKMVVQGFNVVRDLSSSSGSSPNDEVLCNAWKAQISALRGEMDEMRVRLPRQWRYSGEYEKIEKKVDSLDSRIRSVEQGKYRKATKFVYALIPTTLMFSLLPKDRQLVVLDAETARDNNSEKLAGVLSDLMSAWLVLA